MDAPRRWLVLLAAKFAVLQMMMRRLRAVELRAATVANARSRLLAVAMDAVQPLLRREAGVRFALSRHRRSSKNAGCVNVRSTESVRRAKARDWHAQQNPSRPQLDAQAHDRAARRWHTASIGDDLRGQCTTLLVAAQLRRKSHATFDRHDCEAYAICAPDSRRGGVQAPQRQRTSVKMAAVPPGGQSWPSATAPSFC